MYSALQVPASFRSCTTLHLRHFCPFPPSGNQHIVAESIRGSGGHVQSQYGHDYRDAGGVHLLRSNSSSSAISSGGMGARDGMAGGHDVHRHPRQQFHESSSTLDQQFHTPVLNSNSSGDVKGSSSIRSTTSSSSDIDRNSAAHQLKDRRQGVLHDQLGELAAAGIGDGEGGRGGGGGGGVDNSFNSAISLGSSGPPPPGGNEVADQRQLSESVIPGFAGGKTEEGSTREGSGGFDARAGEIGIHMATAAMLVGGMNGGLGGIDSVVARSMNMGGAAVSHVMRGMVGTGTGSGEVSGKGDVAGAGGVPSGGVSVGLLSTAGMGIEGVSAGRRGRRTRNAGVDIGTQGLRNTDTDVRDTGALGVRRLSMHATDLGLQEQGQTAKRRKIEVHVPEQNVLSNLPSPPLPPPPPQQQQHLQHALQRRGQDQQQLQDGGATGGAIEFGGDSITSESPGGSRASYNDEKDGTNHSAAGGPSGGKQVESAHADSRLCQFAGCRRGPCYGHDGDKRATFCASHHTPGMVNVVSPRCARDGCRLGPSYNEPGERKAVFCSGHRMPGMVNVVSPRCQQPGCTRGPSYGHDGDRKAIFCSGHRLQGMVNVVSPRCMEAGCLRGPSYGFEGRRARFCAKHKQEGMVNVVSPRCQEAGCTRGPSYGFAGARRASFCAKHKQDGMVNVVSRKCSASGCWKGPRFGQNGDRKASFCSLHKRDDMVSIATNARYLSQGE